jgi:hypothetical protein
VGESSLAQAEKGKMSPFSTTIDYLPSPDLTLFRQGHCGSDSSRLRQSDGHGIITTRRINTVLPGKFSHSTVNLHGLSSRGISLASHDTFWRPISIVSSAPRRNLSLDCLNHRLLLRHDQRPLETSQTTEESISEDGNGLQTEGGEGQASEVVVGNDESLSSEELSKRVEVLNLGPGSACDEEIRTGEPTYCCPKHFSLSKILEKG